MAGVNDWIMDLKMNVSRLEGIVDEVDRHIAEGVLDSAAMVLGSQSGKIARFSDSYAGLQQALRNAGADPVRALNP